LIWHKLMTSNRFENFAQLKTIFSSADLIGDYTVFDIGGNKYQLIAHIRYTSQTVFIKHVLTHEEYDRWSQQQRRKS
jgi:mRNA interferase HigB